MALPTDILIDRVRNELKAVSQYLVSAPDLDDPAEVRFPVVIEIELTRVPGYFIEGSRCVPRYYHRFRMVIGPNYPTEKPLVTWLTPIYHPNIMMPEDGGHLCSKLLEGWGFNSTIICFVKGVETLVTNPNPLSPFGTDSCTASAEYFNTRKGHKPPMVSVPPPRVVEDE
ncbi:MAG: hypothetical protein ISF22_02430 [Methanomassiliicoccus sp.]|nr:hypothetical protein [Methanomassiliicoccus sp.]